MTFGQMGYQVLLLLTLFGCMFLESVHGQKGDMAKQNDTEKQPNDLKVLETRLNATTQELKEQRAAIQRLKKENEEMQKEIEGLTPSVGGVARPHVAFSASMVKPGEIYMGPSMNRRTLVFKRVFSNTGNGYDESTGIFMAPVKGMYYFTFSTFGYHTDFTGAILMKNGVRQISTYDDHSGDTSDSGSNAVVLPLEVADRVYVELWDNSQVFDNLNGHTTFSGFLLFPM